MRTIALTALATATAVLVTACSKPTPTPPPPFVETITLHSAGTEPLEQLRLTPEPGTTVTVSNTLTFEHELLDDHPPTILTTTYHTPAKSSKNELLIESLTIDSESGIDIVEDALDDSATLITLTRSLTGTTKEQSFDTFDHSIIATDPDNWLILPEEPVGVGAEWTIRRASIGTRLTTNSTVRFTLISFTPDTITVDVDTRIVTTALSDDSDWSDAEGARTGRIVYDRRLGVTVSGSHTGPYTQFSTSMNVTNTYSAAD